MASWVLQWCTRTAAMPPTPPTATPTSKHSWWTTPGELALTPEHLLLCKIISHFFSGDFNNSSFNPSPVMRRRKKLQHSNLCSTKRRPQTIFSPHILLSGNGSISAQAVAATLTRNPLRGSTLATALTAHRATIARRAGRYAAHSAAKPARGADRASLVTMIRQTTSLLVGVKILIMMLTLLYLAVYIPF